MADPDVQVLRDSGSMMGSASAGGTRADDVQTFLAYGPISMISARWGRRAVQAHPDDAATGLLRLQAVPPHALYAARITQASGNDGVYTRDCATQGCILPRHHDTQFWCNNMNIR